jgi:hypothetical protein
VLYIYDFRRKIMMGGWFGFRFACCAGRLLSSAFTPADRNGGDTANASTGAEVDLADGA